MNKQALESPISPFWGVGRHCGRLAYLFAELSGHFSAALTYHSGESLLPQTGPPEASVSICSWVLRRGKRNLSHQKCEAYSYLSLPFPFLPRGLHFWRTLHIPEPGWKDLWHIAAESLPAWVLGVEITTQPVHWTSPGKHTKPDCISPGFLNTHFHIFKSHCLLSCAEHF